MKIFKLAAALALGMASFTAQATVYTYTGNLFTVDQFIGAPARVVAHIEFDFEHSPYAAQGGYHFKHWDVAAGTLYLSSEKSNDDFYANFSFDSTMNITNWSFIVNHIVKGDASQAIQIGSRSANVLGWPPGQAKDYALSYVSTAAVFDNPGTWTVTGTDVPEPASLLLVGVGAAAFGAARQRRKK